MKLKLVLFVALIGLSSVISAEVIQKAGRSQEGEDWTWTLDYMPDGSVQIARSMALLYKGLHRLTTGIMAKSKMSFTEMTEEYQRWSTNVGNRRNAEDDPMVQCDLDWEETRCLYQEYGPFGLMALNEHSKKYWKKSKRCGDA